MRTPTCHGRTNPDCTARHHGTHTAYRHGCRCPHAREQDRIYRKRLRENRQPPALVDATGTARRLQALNRIGWRFTDLAARLGCTYQNVALWAAMTSPRVDRTTATRVANLYRELAGTPGPSALAAQRAAAKGWHSPIAWDNIDDPNEQPDLGVVNITRGETLAERAVRHAQRLEEFRNLRDAGVGRKRIQDQLHINSKVYVKLLAQIQDTDAGQVAA